MIAISSIHYVPGSALCRMFRNALEPAAVLWNSGICTWDYNCTWLKLVDMAFPIASAIASH